MRFKGHSLTRTDASVPAEYGELAQFSGLMASSYEGMIAGMRKGRSTRERDRTTERVLPSIYAGSTDQIRLHVADDDDPTPKIIKHTATPMCRHGTTMMRPIQLGT